LHLQLTVILQALLTLVIINCLAPALWFQLTVALQALLTLASVVINYLGPAMQLWFMVAILMLSFILVVTCQPFKLAQLHTIHCASLVAAFANVMLLMVLTIQEGALLALGVVITITIGNGLFILGLLGIAVKTFRAQRQSSAMAVPGVP
jgi:hypothetical protein